MYNYIILNLTITQTLQLNTTAGVSKQLTYAEKFTRDNVVAPFYYFLLSYCTSAHRRRKESENEDYRIEIAQLIQYGWKF